MDASFELRLRDDNSVESLARAIVVSVGAERALCVADRIRALAKPFGKAVRPKQ